MMLEESEISGSGIVLDPAAKPKRRTYTAEYRARVLEPVMSNETRSV